MKRLGKEKVKDKLSVYGKVFFAVAVLLLLNAFTHETQAAPLVSALYGLLIIAIACVGLVKMFKRFCNVYALKKEGEARRKDPECIKGDVKKSTVSAYAFILFLYILVLLFTLVCDKTQALNQVVLNEVSGLITSLRTDFATGSTYILSLIVQIAAYIAVAMMACMVTGGGFFRTSKTIVALFLTISFFICERFVAQLMLSASIELLGGIEHIFETMPVMGAALVMILEALFYSLMWLLNIVIIQRMAVTKTAKK